MAMLRLVLINLLLTSTNFVIAQSDYNSFCLEQLNLATDCFTENNLIYEEDYAGVDDAA
jgi:hypothetical protein